MNGLVGHLGVGLALLGALGAAGSVGAGLRRRRADLVRVGIDATLVALLGLLLAVVAMEHALLTHDFTLAYVAENNARETPVLFSVTGLWSALQGSLLLWAVILVGYLVVVGRRYRARADDPVVGWALLVGLAIAVFFLALLIGPADPFLHTVGAIPPDGAGPNALLQDNTLVAIHPPLLYLGYVGFTVPFCFAIASLITGRVGEGWLVETRRFAIVAFACLTVGIMLGSWWSYQVLGWGGFWGWDPVENAALLPWLTATAYLHSVMVQERRGLLRVWNLSLLIATFSLTIFGTFLTRSDVVESVHNFSTSGVGPPLLALFGAAVLGGVALIGWRGDRLRSPGSVDAIVSREGAFLVNNFLFAAFALVVLVGTVLPVFIQALTGNASTIGAPYFDTFSVPLGIALLFFMAVAPALPWRKGTPELLGRRLAVPAWSATAILIVCVGLGVRGFTPLVAFGLGAFAAASALRQLVLAARAAHHHGLSWLRGVVGRANGGMIAHLGIVVIAVGIAAASAFAHRSFVTLSPGQSVTVDGQVIRLVSVAPFIDPSRSGDEATVEVNGGTVLRPALDVFGGTSQGVSTPAFTSSVFEDVYIAANTLSPTKGHESATFQVIVQPLVAWLWIGGAIVGAGALLAAWPGRRRRPTDPSTVALPELEDDPLDALALR